jgi:SAM-dependent methyltransferase
MTLPDPLPQFPAGSFDKNDIVDDAEFYLHPRMVTHIDQIAIASLTAFYAEVFPADGVLLDLMSSWVSHLPHTAHYREVIGHGMNAAELAANPQLDRWFVQNLNRDQSLDFADNSLDGAAICVGIQYLESPVAVLAELARALRPGAPVVISFSNRCFPTKAVAIWRETDDQTHADLVKLYLQAAGFGAVQARLLQDGRASDPLIAVVGRAPA